MPWEKGKSGNPNGRPKGSRNQITQAFLNDLEDSWRKNGASALQAALEKDPVGYVKVVASLLPKEMIIEKPVDGLSDDELASVIDAIRNARAKAGGDAGQAGGGTETAGGSEPTGGISTLH